jgi:hypothetical protein
MQDQVLAGRYRVLRSFFEQGERSSTEARSYRQAWPGCRSSSCSWRRARPRRKTTREAPRARAPSPRVAAAKRVRAEAAEPAEPVLRAPAELVAWAAWAERPARLAWRVSPVLLEARTTREPMTVGSAVRRRALPTRAASLASASRSSPSSVTLRRVRQRTHTRWRNSPICTNAVPTSARPTSTVESSAPWIRTTQRGPFSPPRVHRVPTRERVFSIAARATRQRSAFPTEATAYG